MIKYTRKYTLCGFVYAQVGDSFKGLAVRHLPQKYHVCYLCLQSKDCLVSWCKKPSAMPTLLDLLTEQLSTNNTHALASSSFATMHLKTLQMQSDNPNNGILRIKLTYLFPCFGSEVVLSHNRLVCKTSCAYSKTDVRCVINSVELNCS